MTPFLSGFPIKALYGPDGNLVRSALFGGDLDECNGMGEGADYAYYISAEPPFVPTCFKGKKIGKFSYDSSGKLCPKNGIVNRIAGAEVAAPTVNPKAADSPRAKEPSALASIVLATLVLSSLASIVLSTLVLMRIANKKTID